MYFLSQTYRQFYPNTHTYQYDANGNLTYVATGRKMKDGHTETEFGRIKNIPVFIYQNGRHSVLDNDIFIKNGEKYR